MNGQISINSSPQWQGLRTLEANMQIYFIHRRFFLITIVVVLVGMWAGETLRSGINLQKWDPAETPAPECCITYQYPS